MDLSVPIRPVRSITIQNNYTNIVTPKVSIGDLVLVRRAQKRFHKPKFNWFGPYVIIDVHSSLVCSVTPLRRENQEKVYCARLLIYGNSLNGQEVSKELLNLAERTAFCLEIIEKSIDLGDDNGEVINQLKWKVLTDKMYCTW